MLSKGSSSSLKDASRRMAWPMFSHVEPNEASALSTSTSTLRVYVCDEMMYAEEKPAFAVTSSSSFSTLSWSPSKIWRNDACG